MRLDYLDMTIEVRQHRLPPGWWDGEWFYPFMVDCPNQAWEWSHKDCEYGCIDKQVRNPALEWRCVTAHHRHDPDAQPYGSCERVAVGVKEVSE